MGHSHTPAVVEFNGGTYVNLGNWMGRRRTYLELDEQGMKLKEFE